MNNTIEKITNYLNKSLGLGIEYGEITINIKIHNKKITYIKKTITEQEKTED